MNTSMIDWLRDDRESTTQPLPDSAVAALRLGLSEPHRPVDDLISRLWRPDGSTWFEKALETALGVDIRESLLSKSASVDQLTAWKDAARRLIGAAPTVDQSRGALAAYCMCFAAAKAHYRAHISGQPPEEWTELLVDLFDVVPQRWQPLLQAAIGGDM